MLNMLGNHQTQQRILFGAVEQTRQRLALGRPHCRNCPERERRHGCHRTGLRNRPERTNGLVTQSIRRNATGYGHHRARVPKRANALKQRAIGELRFAAARRPQNHQRPGRVPGAVRQRAGEQRPHQIIAGLPAFAAPAERRVASHRCTSYEIHHMCATRR